MHFKRPKTRAIGSSRGFVTLPHTSFTLNVFVATQVVDVVANLSALKELTPKQVLAVRCPTCGAPPGEQCELSTGLPRMNPHRDRKFMAAD